MAYVHSRSYEEIKTADEILKALAEENDLLFIELLDLFCEGPRCLSAVKQGETYEPFVWDYGHLTKSSSSLVAGEIKRVLSQEGYWQPASTP